MRISTTVASVLAAIVPAWAAPASTIVILGSSTAAGIGASTYANSWAGRLTAAVSPMGFQVQNVSISGTNTSDSLNRFDADVTPKNPRFVILATSIANEPAADAADSWLQNTLLLIRKVENIGAIPVVVAPYPYGGFSATMYASIKSIYTSLNAQGVNVLDFLDATDDGHGHWLPGLSVDGTHPTDTGHAILFDAIPVTLFSALQSARPPVNPHASGTWVQSTDLSSRGDVEITPVIGMGSWTVSFWIEPSPAVSDRAILTINSGLLQLRRAGSVWQLWKNGASIASTQVSTAPSFRHVALSYQNYTGTLNWYVDGQLRADLSTSGASAITDLSLGGDASSPNWNAFGDSFADVLLYRAPLQSADIVSIHAGQTPWKSVEAWLPLVFSPARPTQNLAAGAATVAVHGSWTWSAGPASRELPGSVPNRGASPLFCGIER